jgi:hypothetical protein
LPGCRLKGLLRDAQERFHESLNRDTLADCLPERFRRGTAITPRASVRSRRVRKLPRSL